VTAGHLVALGHFAALGNHDPHGSFHAGLANEYPEIARGITREEFLEAMEWAKWHGLTNLDPHAAQVRDLYRRRRE
jgi:hypothetical protein